MMQFMIWCYVVVVTLFLNLSYLGCHAQKLPNPETPFMAPIPPDVCQAVCTSVMRAHKIDVLDDHVLGCQNFGCLFNNDVLPKPNLPDCATLPKFNEKINKDQIFGCEVGRDIAILGFNKINATHGIRANAKGSLSLELLPELYDKRVSQAECQSCCKVLDEKFDSVIDYDKGLNDRFDVEFCVKACESFDLQTQCHDQSDHRSRCGCSIPFDFYNNQKLIYSTVIGKDFKRFELFCVKGDIETSLPTASPTNYPTTDSPTGKPTYYPTVSPTTSPTLNPTANNTRENNNENKDKDKGGGKIKFAGMEIDLTLFIAILVALLSFCGMVGMMILYTNQQRKKREMNSVELLKGIEVKHLDKSEVNRLSVAAKADVDVENPNKNAFAKFTSVNSFLNKSPEQKPKYVSTWMQNTKKSNEPDLPLRDTLTYNNPQRMSSSSVGVPRLLGTPQKGPKGADVRLSVLTNENEVAEVVDEEFDEDVTIMKFPSEMPLHKIYQATANGVSNGTKGNELPVPPPKISTKVKKPEKMNDFYRESEAVTVKEPDDKEVSDEEETDIEEGSDDEGAPIPPPKKY